MALFAFVPAVLGLVALAEFPNIEANNAVATVALNLMPPIMAGFVMAAVVSATLSSGAGDLLGAATVFTKDIVEHHFGKSLTDAQLTSYSRLCVLFLGIIAIVISLVKQSHHSDARICFTMRSAGPFAAFLLGPHLENATAGAGILVHRARLHRRRVLGIRGQPIRHYVYHLRFHCQPHRLCGCGVH